MVERPFEAKEKLYRAVLKSMWSKGRPTSAAFKLRPQRNEKELSFDREAGRTKEDCISYMRKNLRGNIVSVTVNDCEKLNLTVTATPGINPYHTSVYETTPGWVSDLAALQLAKIVVVEDCQEA